ncbi:MAG: hypothetical protein ACLSE7_07180 [Lachnospirales bacterium]
MSVFSALFNNGIRSAEQAFNAKDITSGDMRKAIQDWYGLYYNMEPTDQEDPCQRIPVAVVNKLTKTVFSEYSAAPAKDAGKADWCSKILGGLERRRKQAMQQALIGGECFLKPLLSKTGAEFSVINRQNYLVLGRSETGAVTDVGTLEQTETGGKFYTLLERRTVDAGGYLTIENKLYCSNDRSTLGGQVPLETLPQYAALEPSYTFQTPLFSLGLIPVRCPAENCVDGSDDAVSVYAAAVGLIHNINRNEAQINGEFERGKSRIFVDETILVDRDGHKALADDVFVGAPSDYQNGGGIAIFSPAFREQSFLARKQEYLRNVETLIGLKRGILSEVEAAERTATEITSSAGDYNLSIIDFQQMWEAAVRETVRVCDLLGRMYKLCDSAAVDPEQDVAISFGNGILYDEDKTWAQYTALVASGMLKPEIAVAWYFDLPFPETPEDLMKIRERYMPEIESLTGSGGDE